MSPGPIFVVGTMRSGSTLLRLVLDSHPHIAIGEETGFMGALAATKAIPGWRYGREWYGRLGWSEEELDARLRDFYGGMFQRHASRQGKQRWGDKTPFHSWHIPEMARVFPDAVFLGIARHPGAVVWSLKKKFHYATSQAASYWASTNVEMLRQGALLGDRFALLRYEDLVHAPEPTLRDTVAWLGEPWSDAVLNHQEVQAAKGAPRLVDGSTSTREPIDTQRVDRWTEGLDAAERALLQAETGPLAAFLGYDPADPVPVADIAAPGAGDAPGSPHPPASTRLLRGPSLAERQRSWPDRDLLAPRPQPVIAAEMTTEDLVTRLEKAEAALARIRARPVVRASEAVRRAQRRLPPVPRLGPLRRRPRRLGPAARRDG